ncbi:CAP domain-containing protein [Beggiatoa leptomitoformis]|uniref:CAP domain-containing protein n=1 Tax=Beggiatoa leptomitoformis TaxID=288004 RepID=A0A2N9YBB0_9GAMM|nr:CAP domain-containing protein [Beggiatoa leptomitoformis]ALG66875.1 CAP domain-containing protein [Beggiatoa leptomitoformis]AUI67768.1 CAP domain-containing protein [Beggiatoa leptomitoformis]
MYATINTLLILTNTARHNAGLAAVECHPILMNSAQKHAEEMAQHNYVDHIDLHGWASGDRLKAQGYEYRFAGENISAGINEPIAMMNGWMSSTGHRANILKPEFTVTGFGYAYCENSSYKHYWVQVFASPLF